MSYTFLSAKYGEADRSVVITDTQEVGLMVVSEKDTPEAWLALLRSKIPIAAYSAAPLFSEDYQQAIQKHIDSTAREKEYDSGVTCSSYANSTVSLWREQSHSFIAWRDAVWLYSNSELGKVLAGAREQPTIAEFLEELPKLEWPEQ